MTNVRHSVGTFFIQLLVILAAAVLASLAFPNPISETGWGLLAFISLIPMFWVINRSSWKATWFFGWAYGFVFYLIYNYWLKTFHPLAILIAPIIESVQYLLLFMVLKAATSLFAKRGYLVQSVFYVAYLYLTQQGFLGYPYGNISAALWNYPVLIQSASVFGIWGICLLLTVPQTFIASLRGNPLKRGAYRIDICIYAGFFLLNLIWGMASLRHYDVAEPERTIRVAAVQHSADSWQGGYPTYTRNFETLTRLSLEAMEEDPDMIVWSETAFVPSVAWHMEHPSNWVASRLCERFIDFGLSLPVPLLTGNPEGLIKDDTLPAFLDDGSWNWKTYNTVILFGGGDILGTYRKQRLVPFTEHFPYEEQMPWLYEFLLSNDYKWWEKGTESTVYNWDGVSFSTPICFEDTFGYLNADFVRDGADVLVNLTNDSWSGSVAAQMQHMQLSVFRAIENRRPLLRSANSGMTCLILPSGRVVDMLEPFAEAWNVYEIPIGLSSGLTFYTRHPDILAKLLLACVPGLFALGIVVGYRRRKARLQWEYLHQYDHLFEQIDEYFC